MTNSMAGKVALVTGGSRGLGKVISKKLANSGAEVFVNYRRSKEAVDLVISEIKEDGGIAYAVQGDITSEDGVIRLIQDIQDGYGKKINILVNNATGPQPEMSLEDVTWGDYLDQLNFFVKGPLLLTKAVLPTMKTKGYGRIINIGSEVVQLGNPNFSNYVTAKSAMIGMTRSWANELGPFGITVNLVNPGFTPVERHNNVSQEALNSYMSNIPLRRMGEPSDIADTVVFLASDKAKFITGQCISVNGGNTFGI